MRGGPKSHGGKVTVNIAWVDSVMNGTRGKVDTHWHSWSLCNAGDVEELVLDSAQGYENEEVGIEIRHRFSSLRLQ